MPTRRAAIPISVGLTLAVATPALGNTASAAMLAGAAHMVAGNAVFGIIEGAVLIGFGARTRALWMALLANYVSATVGALLALPAFELFLGLLGDDYLAKVMPATYLVFVTFTLLGLAIELPFFWFAFAKPRRAGRVVLAAALGNVATALLLAGWYEVTTNMAMARAFEPAPVAAIVDQLEGATPWVYYIAPDEVTVRRARLDGTGDERVLEAPASLEGLSLQTAIRTDGKVDLTVTGNSMVIRDAPFWTQKYEAENWHETWRVASLGLVCLLASEVGAAGTQHLGFVYAGYPAVFDHVSLAKPEEDAVIYVSPFAGLTLRGPERDLMLDGPVGLEIGPRCVSVLLGDILVFDLTTSSTRSSRGIYVASIRTMQHARLPIDGRSPCVVYEVAPPNWEIEALLRSRDN